MSRGKTDRKLRRKSSEGVAAGYFPSCFICDKPVKSNGIQIIFGQTPYSNIGLPAKIGQLIGDSFMVVVGESDIMCSRCASLISQLDKLESDARTVKKTLTGYIAMKYQLNHKEICAKIDHIDGELGSRKDPNGKVSDSFVPKQMQRDMKRKVSQVSLLSANIMKPVAISCENCNFSTTDKDALQIHSALCLKPVNLCSHCGGYLNHQSELTSYAGTCNICSLHYDSESEYSKHMILHIEGGSKCAACLFTSARKNDLLSHVLSHGLQVFQCSVCEDTFNIKTDFNEHLGSHGILDKCLRCSVLLMSQSKPSAACDIDLACISGESSTNEPTTGLKGKAVNEYVESLMRADGFDSDGCNIEFHPCPNCGLTFLNKMLFSEHMKMHDESQSQEVEVDLNNSQDDVLKSTAVSVAGDCSIDDDLEDLFEKLHAESASSSQNHVAEGCDQLVQAKSCTPDLNFSESLKSEQATFCASASGTITNLIRRNIEMEQTTLVANLETVAFNSFDDSLSGKERICANEESSNELFDSTEQQTFIYITNSEDLTSFNSQDGIIVQSATIDPESGNIQLLPYVINSSISPSQLMQPTVFQKDVNCSEKNYILEQNFSKEKSELEMNPAADNPATDTIVSSSTFSCDFCSFQTSFELVLKRHLKIHQGNMVRKCSICNRVFSSTQRLLSHIDLRHSDADLLRCPFCSDELENSTLLREHLVEKHPAGKQNFSCRFCPRKFLLRKLCTAHEESHSEIFKVNCEMCKQIFMTQDELDDHVKWDHHKAGHCRYCGKKIDKAKALKHHELRHMQESNHHECPECKRVFKTKTGLRHHAATHTGQFKYCCDFCGRGFMSRMMLEEHRSCHTKEERYICDVCGQKFTFQSTYWIHKKWHETPFPYKCNYCERFFKHSSLLAVHKRKHTGERPYKCPHCPLTFPVSGTLKRHMILHTGVYPFNCEICKRGFTARHKFASHLEKVHHTKEPNATELKIGTSELLDSAASENVKEWDLDDITLEENVQQFGMAEESSAVNRDPLISDQNMSSRVVQIVYEDSYQPVATVTLGGSDSIISENWYV